MSAPLAFVDTETTGVHPGRRAWEVAIIRREANGDESTLHTRVSDVDLSAADPFGLRIGRFYDRHPQYARRVLPGVVKPVEGSNRLMVERDVAEAVEWMTRGAHLVGAVPNFDAEVFDAMLRRHRLVPAWHHHLIDVEALAVGYLAGRRPFDHNDPVVLPWKSDDLSRACGVEPASEEDRHTALGDAKWAMRLFDAITREAS